ncbi:MAG: flagellin [Micavibrio sp.]|nr:flagellin [Micavibrio sp.]
MVDRVSTYAQSTRIASDLMRLQSSYAQGQMQESSSLKSENYQGIASSAQRLLNLETDYSKLSNQSETSQLALDQANSMYSALSTMTDLVTSMKTTISAALGGTGDSGTDLSTVASGTWDEFVAALNTQQAGAYVFGGGVTDAAPVDRTDSDYAAATVPSTADTSYYQGDDYTKTVKASDTLTVSYGVTADNPAFEQAMRAFNIISNNPSDTDALKEAYNLLDTALTGLSNVQSGVSNNAATLDNQINQNATDLNTLDSVISDIKNVDVSAVLLKLTNLQTQIESSYSISSNLLKMNLTEYL